MLCPLEMLLLDKPRHRRSIRLKGYDYAWAGAYFVTVCIEQKKCLFGRVANGEMTLSSEGKIVKEEWLKTAEVRPYIS